MIKLIPYCRQHVSLEDIDAVAEVLKSDYLTTGPCVPKFEKEIALKVNAKHAIATNSATSALHIACLALDLNEGDWLWTSPITFVASANCGLYCGASIDFVDINPKSGLMDVKLLEEKLEIARKKNKLPKVVIPVHLSGCSCEMEKIKDLSLIYGFSIIEDASHAIGASYKDEPVGSCKYSEITVFSFHPVKIITTGEGGLLLTDNKKYHKFMKEYHDHGHENNPKLPRGEDTKTI